ncbi:hypothetical protein WG66_013150, partial [Moniliophthora roreri]
MHTPGIQDAEDTMVMEMKQSERILRRKWGIDGALEFSQRRSDSNLTTAISADLFFITFNDQNENAY